jgi:hypothetical protein
MQVIVTAILSGINEVFSLSYNWHYALRAPPNSRSPTHPQNWHFSHKPPKKQSKGMQAHTRPAWGKKARVYKQPIMIIRFLKVSAALAFFPRLHGQQLSFFSFFLLEY